MDNYTAELEKILKIRKTMPGTITRSIWSLIVKYWDYFCAKGAKHTILDYEFAINTGASPPICYHKPTYSPYKAPIIMKKIISLLDSDWISERGGQWSIQIVLAAKPHQEHINDTNKFIWWICISYRGLNKVTRIYDNPIPQCDMAVTIF